MYIYLYFAYGQPCTVKKGEKITEKKYVQKKIVNWFYIIKVDENLQWIFMAHRLVIITKN